MRAEAGIVKKIRMLFMQGKSQRELWSMGFPLDAVSEAIERCELRTALPSVRTQIVRCKTCRHKCYENGLRGGVCRACAMRAEAERDRKGMAS